MADGMASKNELVCKAAMEMATKGWHIVKLNGVTEGGGCTCGGAACQSVGKHPVGNQWQNQATTDEDTIAAWFEDERPWNIGVRLGPTSGIVDVEADDDHAIEVMQRFGLDQIDTPAYRGSRGPHYLFRYEPGLPDAGVVKVDGLEVRIGGGDKATQSVFPPSQHRSGVTYAWLPGRGLDDCEPAPLPEEFKKALLGDQAAGMKAGGCVRDAREKTAAGEKITAGGRHRYLLGMVSDLVHREPNLQACRDRVLSIARALNHAQCEPPKDDAEVIAIVDSQIRFYARSRAAGLIELRGDAADAEDQLARAQTPLERTGLVRAADGHGWDPGEWRLTIVHSDPVRYVISMRNPFTGKPVDVSMTTDDWLSPTKVAKRILEDTAVVDVTDPNPKAWAMAWGGFTVRDQQLEVRGLKSKLTENPFVAHYTPPPEEKLHAVWAARMLAYLGRYTKPEDETQTDPSPTGEPKWIFYKGNLELWFRWSEAWVAVAEECRGLMPVGKKEEISKRVREVTDESEFSPGFRKSRTGTNMRFTRWTEKHIRALEVVAESVPASVDC